MANIFPKWTNELPWKLLVCSATLLAVIVLGVTYYFTPKYTRVGYGPDQPMSFSHALHVQQLGMDCRFCHSFTTTAAHADVPTTQTCMSCHQQIKADSPKLAPLRESWKTGKPVNWVRVHHLPDYVYFNHAAHVTRGVSCYSCHGSVQEMDAVWQRQPMSMSWCLSCHRSPENFLRPPDQVFNMAWKASSLEGQHAMGMQFKKEWDVNPPVNCGGCHR